MPKEIVQIDAAKTPSGLAIIDSVSRKESTNDDMEVDDVVVKKRGPLLTFFSYLLTYSLTHYQAACYSMMMMSLAQSRIAL